MNFGVGYSIRRPLIRGDAGDPYRKPCVNVIHRKARDSKFDNENVLTDNRWLDRTERGVRRISGTHTLHIIEKRRSDFSYSIVVDNNSLDMNTVHNDYLSSINIEVEGDVKRYLIYSYWSNNIHSDVIGLEITKTNDPSYPIEDDEFLVPELNANNDLVGYYVCRKIPKVIEDLIDNAINKETLLLTHLFKKHLLVVSKH